MQEIECFCAEFRKGARMQQFGNSLNPVDGEAALRCGIVDPAKREVVGGRRFFVLRTWRASRAIYDFSID